MKVIDKFKLSLVCLQLVPYGTHLEHIPDPGQYLNEVEGLHYIVFDSQLQHIHLVPDIADCGEYNYGDLHGLTFRLEAFGNLKPAHIRHEKCRLSTGCHRSGRPQGPGFGCAP